MIDDFSIDHIDYEDFRVGILMVLRNELIVNDRRDFRVK